MRAHYEAVAKRQISDPMRAINEREVGVEKKQEAQKVVPEAQALP